MTYNMTPLQNATNFVDIMVAANDYTDFDGQFKILANGILISFFIVLTLSLRNYEMKDVLVAAGFSSFLLGLFLAYIGLISLILPFMFLILPAIIIVFDISKG